MNIDQQQTFAINLMENLIIATFVLDPAGKVIIWNHACERLTGIKAEEVLGTDEHWKALYTEKRTCLADALLKGETSALDELYEFHAQPSNYGNGYRAENWCSMPRLGNRHYLAIDVGPIYDGEGQLIAVVETLRDMTDYKTAQTALEELAVVDDMTGISNRRYFDERLNIEWKLAQRLNHPLSLIMIDVDYFKQFNDTYGHQEGDKCLKTVAKAIQQSVFRGTEAVCRYGGEEFCILLPSIDLDGAYVIAERVKENLEKLKLPHKASKVSDWVTISCGVSTSTPKLEDDALQLIALADEALYQAKDQGRNQNVKAQ
jgi:diguanylate cyclase (GGDEF)-like protein/PAS domain S-box-containing protein